ncbi:MAG: hypothetical protein Q9214_000337 [Letrouitia sp. 1 TL-2023]
MGKRWADKNRTSRGGQTRQRADYHEIEKQNEAYEYYYNELLDSEYVDRDEFWKVLRCELPNSFRFAGSKRHALQVQKVLKDRYIPEITSIEYEGLPVEPPAPVSWFPEQLAWQMTTPKKIIRRFAPFKSFQRFLVSETSVGNISRQEIVSMIPPLLLDVRPGMIVMDLCAAPGSKSAQLIEMLHEGEETRILQAMRNDGDQKMRGMNPESKGLMEESLGGELADWSDNGRSTGLLIANDVDYKRAHMLIHQIKRLNSPNLIVTNHDATMYPSIKLPPEPVTNNKPVKGKYLKFDRILADVPCSGDGTSRKNLSMWKNWSPGNALGLFTAQVRILVRALQMTKAGGRVVYSTCSMNPVENEAVVATALERCGGISRVDLVDCSDRLPGLKYMPGLHEWKVMDKLAKIWNTWSDVELERELNGEAHLGKLVKEMFPRNGSLPLDRCMRIYPHLQNTGGFFIAVLEKKFEVKETTGTKSQHIGAKSSVIASVEEIEAKTAEGADPISKIETLDAIAPSQVNEDVGFESAAARQNKEVAPAEPLSAQKHKLDDEADEFMSTKRLKVRDEIDDAAPRGEEDRQVHWSPPPGAQLEFTRPTAVDSVDSVEPGLTHQTPSYKAKSDKRQPYEEPFKYLDPSHAELESVYQFYELSPDFPKDRFMVRNATGTPAKTIYYTSALARDILTSNERSGLKFVHCGIKMFVKQDVQKEGVCKWRIQTEGLPIIETSIGERRVVRLTRKETLKSLLVEMFPKVDGQAWNDLGEIGQRVRDIGMGCYVLRVEKGERENNFRYSKLLRPCALNSDNADGWAICSERMVLPLWRSFHSVNLMLPKEERKAMLLRLYNDDSPLEDHSKDRFLKSKENRVTVDTDHDRDTKGREIQPGSGGSPIDWDSDSAGGNEASMVSPTAG